MTSDFAQSLHLSRYAHDRDSVSRSREGFLDELWSRESTRVLILRGGMSLGRRAGATGDNDIERMVLTFLSTAHVDSLELDIEHRVYLGRTGEAPERVSYVGVVLPAESPANPADGDEWFDLRAWGHTMSDLDTGLLTQALALANWHDSHRFAPATGEPTDATSSGWVRSTASARQVFPRTDVAVIVLVTDDHDRVLLGNNSLWEPNRFSLLAGYVDPGESLEAAVLREVFEESGITVRDPIYRGSQPWPFPASLMVGFTARVAPGTDVTDLQPDGEEILQLRWFSREELAASLDDIVLPGRTSIARSLIEDWFGRPLDQNAVWLGRA